MTATIETMHIIILRFLLHVFAMIISPCFYMINKSGIFCAASISSLAKDPSIGSQWLLTLPQWYKSLEYSLFRFAVVLTTLYPYLGKIPACRDERISHRLRNFTNWAKIIKTTTAANTITAKNATIVFAI